MIKLEDRELPNMNINIRDKRSSIDCLLFSSKSYREDLTPPLNLDSIIQIPMIPMIIGASLTDKDQRDLLTVAQTAVIMII